MSEEPQTRTQERHVVVVGPDGQPVGSMRLPDEEAKDDSRNPANQVDEPAKVMRIGTMVKQLLEEVRAAPLDLASRSRMRDIYETSIGELEQGLAPELRDELHRLSLPFGEGEVPSEAELRIAQAQLVGWLEGLFHGIQTALVAQQMAARVQLDQMRRALPAGPGGSGGPAMPGGSPGGSPGDRLPGTGQYL